MTVNIARCPEHGLHGERPECFACGGPVERVAMVPCDDAAVQRAAEAIRAGGFGIGPGVAIVVAWTALDAAGESP